MQHASRWAVKSIISCNKQCTLRDLLRCLRTSDFFACVHRSCTLLYIRACAWWIRTNLRVQLAFQSKQFVGWRRLGLAGSWTIEAGRYQRARHQLRIGACHSFSRLPCCWAEFSCASFGDYISRCKKPIRMSFRWCLCRDSHGNLHVLTLSRSEDEWKAYWKQFS